MPAGFLPAAVEILIGKVRLGPCHEQLTIQKLRHKAADGRSGLVAEIDLLGETKATVVCLEAKYQEEGIGQCSCSRTDPGASLVGRCSAKVLERDLYWKTAGDVFGLRDREDGRQCPIAVSYQAIRNVAAARALANGRHEMFALAYDERDPYFTGAGDWRGWVSESAECSRQPKPRVRRS